MDEPQTALRAFDNPFASARASPPSLDFVRPCLASLLGVLDRHSFPRQALSVYTGTCGRALLLLRLARVSAAAEDEAHALHGLLPDAGELHPEAAVIAVASLLGKRPRKRKLAALVESLLALVTEDGTLPLVARHGISFVCGHTGQLALAACALIKLEQHADVVEVCVRTLLAYAPYAQLLEFNGKPVPSEILYGRTGFIYSLLFVLNVSGSALATRLQDQLWRAVGEVAAFMLDVGAKGAAAFEMPDWLATRQAPAPGLMYEWHGSQYMGAAHGLSGILYVLLDDALAPLWSDADGPEALRAGLGPTFDAAAVRQRVLSTCEFLLATRLDSGNYPTRPDSERDRLVQWCHGSPALSLLFSRAFERLGDARFLAAAKDAAEHVWKFGLLRKGPGLCHGTAGNSYAFLKLFHLTQDNEQLHRATWFARFGVGQTLPDPIDWAEHCAAWAQDELPAFWTDGKTPMSLFNGVSGLAWSLVDLAAASPPSFPGMDVRL